MTYFQPPTWPHPSFPGPPAVWLRAGWLANDITTGETVTHAGVTLPQAPQAQRQACLLQGAFLDYSAILDTSRLSQPLAVE